MTKIPYFDLQSFLKEKIQDVDMLKKATSIALGVSIARMLPMPSTEVEFPESHYLTNVKMTANQYCCDFNEAIVVDVELVAETARSFWLIRYSNTYPNLAIPMVSLGQFGFLTKLAGATAYLNNDTYEFCEKYSELMVVITNRITRVMINKED